MARALANRYGTGVLENVYKTKLKRDYISQQYTVFDQSQFSENYFNFTDLPGVVEPARALVNRIGNVDITPGRILVNRMADDGRGFINRMSGNEDGYEYGDQRAVVSRMIDDGRVVTNRLAADGRILVNRMSNTTPTIPIGSNDARALVNRSNTSRFGEPPPIGGPLPARALANRLGAPQPTAQPGVVTDARSLVSRSNSNRVIIDDGRVVTNRQGRALVNFAEEVDDGRAIINKLAELEADIKTIASRLINMSSDMLLRSSSLPGPLPGRALVNRTSTTQPSYNPNVADLRAITSRTSTYRIGELPPYAGPLPARSLVSRTSGGGIEDGYEDGDARSIVSRFGELPPWAGPKPARSLVSRFGELPPWAGPLQARNLVSRTSGGGIEDGYEQGDGRAIINRMSGDASPINRITLTAGKNVIKFAADGQLLRRDMPIDLEVLDKDGNPLYTEISDYQDRFGYYYAVIYVYDITSPGVGTVSFVGHAQYDMNGNQLPQSEAPNIIWVAYVDIKPTERNNTEIVFEKAPIVDISQVLVPYTFNRGTYALNSSLVTQSLYGLSIIKSDNIGYDFEQSKAVDILDQGSKENSYNYFAESITTNTVETNARKYNNDILNGFVYSEFSRFNTILHDPSGRLKKDMEGSIFSFENTDSGLSYTSSYTFIPPYTSSTKTPTTDVIAQLDTYKSKIAYVLNNNYALLEQAPSVEIFDSTNAINPIKYNNTFKKVSNVSGSFIYPTSSLNVITSQNLSSSFIQFTISDLQPLVGDVYRIKTYIKEAGSNTEFKQLNDHITVAPEYLTDSDKPNQAVYAKDKSDFFVYGEMTDATVALDYWRGFGLEGSTIYQYNYNTTSSNPLANSLVITSKASLRKGITSRYYQTYIPEHPFSLSFYCTLDPGCELEVYMGSTPLKDNAIGIQGPKAFLETRNNDSAIPKAYNKFGKFIGKVSNISGSAVKAYDNVVFDFFADADGFGRPVLFLNTNSATDKHAYVSSLSITPLDLVGYTPSIVQFGAPVPDSIWILQDDDAQLTQSIDVKIEYFNYEGKQSEFTTYIPNVQMNLIVEVPGFCSAEAGKFNDHCPLYYEVTTNGTSNTTSAPIANLLTPTTNVTSDPDSYVRSMTWDIDPPPSTVYFWPTYSLNDYNDYYWNIDSFNIGSKYSSESIFWTTSSTTISSLWKRFDPIMPVYDQIVPGTDPFLTMHSINTLTVTQSLGDDDQPFTITHGAMISTIDIALAIDSLPYSSSFTIQQSTAETNNLNSYLKTTRLHFPTNNETYIYGFNENGGIYNVRFKLKRFPQKTKPKTGGLTNLNIIDGITVDGGYAGSNEQVLKWQLLTDIDERYSPFSGAKLMVYLHDVTTPLATGSKWQKGTPGFYPPDNNIVTIGNGYGTAPLLRYYDSGSNAYIDTYDIILVQYGDRAQLVFDASGLELSLSTNDYYNINHVDSGDYTNPALWGGIITDIEWCKIGTTTDTRFIKPANFTETFGAKPKKGTWESDTLSFFS